MAEPGKVEELKRLIRLLHAGEDPDSVRDRFDRLIQGVSADDLAAMEQQLIQEGLPVEEVQRLCDLHVGVVRRGLADPGTPDLPAGHPVRTYIEENRAFERVADRLVGAARDPADVDTSALLEALRSLSKVDLHYLRKENQLFPYLERHGVTGPTQVMWGIHDEIRARLDTLEERIEQGRLEGIGSEIADVARAITEMIYKEEKILFPIALQKLSDEEWQEMRRGEREVGYAFREPPPGPNALSEPSEGRASAADAGSIPLSTGRLTVGQLDRLLTRLPVDISFVDADDRVCFYSDNPDRVFPRSPAVIGRSVEHCHPPKSLDAVRRILRAFKDGSRDEAKFWIELDGRFIVIQYFAVRDDRGTYLGCLEVTQDATETRRLKGEKRLLDWS